MSDTKGPLVVDPIPDATRRLASALGRERTGEILAFVGRRPYCSASEVARAHDIHIATAQKYLRELAACGLLHLRTRDAAPRPIEEFALASRRIHIDIELHVDAKRADLEWARSLHIADGGLPNVVYESDVAGHRIREILVLEEGPRTRVAARFSPGEPLGRVLFHLPPRPSDGAPLLTLMERAGLDAALIPAVRDDLAVLREELPPGVLSLHAVQESRP